MQNKRTIRAENVELACRFAPYDEKSWAKPCFFNRILSWDATMFLNKNNITCLQVYFSLQTGKSVCLFCCIKFICFLHHVMLIVLVCSDIALGLVFVTVVSVDVLGLTHGDIRRILGFERLVFGLFCNNR